MTEWIVDGIQFIVPDQKDSETLKSAIGRAIDTWSHSSDDGDEQHEPATGP
jgi:hypothetical protein